MWWLYENLFFFFELVRDYGGLDGNVVDCCEGGLWRFMAQWNADETDLINQKRRWARILCS